MQTRDLALFLHILSLLAAIGLSTTLHVAEWQARGAKQLRELRVHAQVMEWGKLFPVVIFLLLATGFWLLTLNEDRYEWGTPWVWTAVVALIVLFASGGGILGRHSGQLSKVLASQPEDGPVSDEVHRHTSATLPWAVSYMNTALAISVVFNMVNKPDRDIEAIGTLLAGALLGTVLGALAARPRSAAANSGVG